MALGKANMLGSITFSKILAQRIAMFWKSMRDRLVEPKHSASYSYASDLALYQIVFVGIKYDDFIIMDLG